jgi:hypothetical protein
LELSITLDRGNGRPRHRLTTLIERRVATRDDINRVQAARKEIIAIARDCPWLKEVTSTEDKSPETTSPLWAFVTWSRMAQLLLVGAHGPARIEVCV